MSALLTPRPSSRTSRLTLSERQINKVNRVLIPKRALATCHLPQIAGTIASVRRTRGVSTRTKIEEVLEDDDDDDDDDDEEVPDVNIRISSRVSRSTG